MRREMPVIWNLVKPLAVYYVGYYVVRMIVEMLLMDSGKSFLLEDGSAIVSGIARLGGCAVLFPMLMEEQEQQQKERKQCENAAAKQKGKSILQYVALLIFAVSSVVFFNMLVSFSGLPKQSGTFQEIVGKQYAVSLGMGLFLYAGVSAVVEEVVFRFLLYNRLRRSCGRVAYGVATSAFLFGLYHGNIVQGLYAFVLGVLIALVYVYFDDFLAPVLFHGLGNAVIFSSGSIPGVYDIVFAPAAFWIFGAVTVMGSIFLVKSISERIKLDKNACNFL